MARIIHRAADGTFRKHPAKHPATSGYLSELVKEHNMNPFDRALADPILGHTDREDAPQEIPERMPYGGGAPDPS